MLSSLFSFGLVGIDGFLINIETDVNKGIPTFDVVGLPDAAVKESKERVRSAILNSGFLFPQYKLTLNLAPANIRKVGSSFDLPIAIGILAATEQIKCLTLKKFIFLGELSLNGEIRAVNGILPLIISAKNKGFSKFIIPKENAQESAYVEGVDIFACSSLIEVVGFLKGINPLDPITMIKYEGLKLNTEYASDFKFVKGQQTAKRAIEIAVAGGHNVLLIGPPGMGKTMLAKCIPSIMPKLEFNEALDVTKIHSISGNLDRDVGIVTERPFRTPHHTATTAALCGGGISSKPGEISLATHGVLFLDELPEYSRNTLEALRQPLEDKKITVARAAQTIEYPANFMLVASMNPCPCGNYGSANDSCRCTSSQIVKYLSKLSGPLLDRIDIQVEVDAINYDELKESKLSECSNEILGRVIAARERQLKRYKDTNITLNSEIGEKQLQESCKLNDDCELILRMTFERLKLSARARSRIIKVARTIADLMGSEDIAPSHIAEATRYRTLDRKYWG